MNYNLFFLIIGCASISFTIIVICTGPVINHIVDYDGHENCKLESDQYNEAKKGSLTDEMKKYYTKRINKCKRHNAMYGLEYASLIMDIVLGFVCTLLGLLSYFGAANGFGKIIGIIGLASGIICFILTLVYVCYSGYIFNNDVAYGTFDSFGNAHLKLFPNGAYYKKEGNSGKVTIFNNDKEYLGQYFKYKDLGDCQYNYNKKLYQAYNYYSDNCKEDDSVSNNCEYFYPLPADNNMNKFLYDRWCLSLVLSVFITAANIGLLIFGLLIFNSNGDSSSEAQQVKIE